MTDEGDDLLSLKRGPDGQCHFGSTNPFVDGQPAGDIDNNGWFRWKVRAIQQEMDETERGRGFRRKLLGRGPPLWVGPMIFFWGFVWVYRQELFGWLQ